MLLNMMEKIHNKFPKFLTISASPIKPSLKIQKNENGDLELFGTERFLLDMLSSALKFRYKLVVPRDSEWGKRKLDGNWTGIVEMLRRGEADVSLYTGIDQERMNVVDFSEPYAIEEITYVTHMPHLLPQTLAYIYPFDVIVWSSVLAMLCLIPILAWILSKSRSTNQSALLSAIGSLLRQPTAENIFDSRILLSSWLIVVSLISMSYVAVLASFLTLPLHGAPIRNFEELSVAVRSGMCRCVIRKGTMVVSVMQRSHKRHVNYVAEMIEKNGWQVLEEEYLDENYMDDKTVFIGFRLAMSLMFGKPPFSDKYISGDTLETLKIAMALRKGFCCKDRLDSIINRIKRAGLYKKVLDDAAYKSWIKTSHKDISSDYHPIRYEDITGPLLVLLVGYSISFLSLIVEILSLRWRLIYRSHIKK